MRNRAIQTMVVAGSALALVAGIAVGATSGATFTGDAVAYAAPVASVAAAATASPGTTDTTHAGYGYGATNGYGAIVGGAANTTRAHDEEHLTATAPAGALTPSQASELQEMAEEEKLALDLYTAFAKQYNSRVFSNIAASEANHLASVRSLLKLYGLTDPTAGDAAGVFDSTRVQSLYTTLLAQGKASLAAAYDVGEAVEIDDLARLAEAKTGVSATDVLQVYASLTTASERHLSIFRSH